MFSFIVSLLLTDSCIKINIITLLYKNIFKYIFWNIGISYFVLLSFTIFLLLLNI